VLARLLLHLRLFLQLDRNLFLLLAVPLMPACIIPVGPEFQDPDGLANVAPVIFGWDPPDNSIVVGSNFAVTAKDANGDRLDFRWIVDYPGPASKIVLRDDVKQPAVNGAVPSHWTLDCRLDPLDISLPFHRLTVFVADRPYVDSDDITMVMAPGKSDRADWIWNVSCPPPPGTP
jgi:hypothetical protein